MNSKKTPTRLGDLMNGWKPDKPKTVEQPKAAKPIPLVKPTKDHKLLRFHQPFDKKLPLSEAAQIEAEVSGASFVVFGGSQSPTERRDAIMQFANDLNKLSSEGQQVIAVAVSLN
ncbi:MAG: hypothetical protein ACXV2B_05340 [Halobacteriota archaeon]